MTSDRPLDPFLRQLEEFSDRVFRGQPAPAGELDSATQEAVRRLHAIDRIPPLDRDRIQQRKDDLMNLTAAWPLATEPITPGRPVSNGSTPRAIPLPERLVPRKRRSLILPLVSAAVLLALIGGLIFGIVTNRNDSSPTVPAVIQGTPSPESSPLGSDWGQFRGGVERTGYTSDPGPGSDLTLRWTFTSEESLNGIMEAGGNVIGFGAGGGLYAIDALTGEQVWAVDLSEGTAGEPGTAKLPAVSDGTIYVSTLEGDLVAVDAADGTVLWQQHLAEDTPNSPTVANGTVYLVADGNRFLGFDAETGEQTWEAALPGTVDNQFPTIADGMISIADDSSRVHAFDLESGDLVWSSDDIAAHRVSAYLDGVLYVPGVDGRLTAISAKDGHTIWATEPLGQEALNPVVTESMIVLVVAGMSIQGLDPKTGSVLWTSDLMVSGTHSPHAGGDYVYLHLDDDRYAALALADGTLAASADGVAGAGSTAAVSGEMLFVSGIAGVVRAFGPGEGEPLQAIASPPAAALAPSDQILETGEPAPVEAPTGSAIEADLMYSTTNLPFTVMFQDDGDGHFWLNDLSDGSLKKYDRDFNLLDTWAFGLGSDPGQFDWEVSISTFPDIGWASATMAWTPDGTAYVTDLGNARIQKIGPDGSLIGTWGEPGDGDGQFRNPVEVLLHDDELVVADLGRSDIQWFDLNGNFLRKLSGPQAGTAFMRVTDIAYDSAGNLWVLDTFGHMLHKFDQNNQLLFTIGKQPENPGPGRFDNPGGFSIDEENRVWVADQWNKRIQVFDSDGNLLAVWDGCTTAAGCFMNIGFVVIGGNNLVYVTDYDENGLIPARLLKFRITSMPDVPMMAAATPAAVPEATPVSG